MLTVMLLFWGQWTQTLKIERVDLIVYQLVSACGCSANVNICANSSNGAVSSLESAYATLIRMNES